MALTLVCAPSIIQVSLYDNSFVGRVMDLSYACNICMQRKNMIWQTHAFLLLFLVKCMFHKLESRTILLSAVQKFSVFCSLSMGKAVNLFGFCF